MALVLLPCDLPTWPAIQRHLNQLKGVQDSTQLVDGMLKLHSLCCISLDPDENVHSGVEMFEGLQMFIESTLTDSERCKFFQATLLSIITYALRLKLHKPVNGLHYSLQQQADFTELDRRFVASLVANAFFSTFPRRTLKTHPTLLDCNLNRCFSHLETPMQQKLFKSFLAYFELLANHDPKGKVIFTRQVMSKKAELDMEDWLQCDRPLCPLFIRHDAAKTENLELGSLKICSSSDRIGAFVLSGNVKQDDLIFCAFPELFGALMSTESLEYNETFTVHGMLPVNDVQANVHSLQFQQVLQGENSWLFNTHVCFLNAMDFHLDPAKQFLNLSILRELNKSFTGFRQQPVMSKRLPPIGKSCSSTPPEESNCMHRDDKECKACDKTQSGDKLPLDIMKIMQMTKSGLSNKASNHNCDRGTRDAVHSGSKCDASRLAEPQPIVPSGGEDLLASRMQSPRMRHNENLEASSTTAATIPDVGAFALSRANRRTYGRRLCDRGSSGDSSVYRDCDDILEDEEDDKFCGGQAFQRPLRLVPRSESPTRPDKVCQSDDALEGANMETSFISCCSHLSSSSSEQSEKILEDEDEEGFESCSEEVQINDSDSRRTTIVDDQLPDDFESSVVRRLSATLLDRKVRPHLFKSSTEESSVGLNSADAEDREEEDFFLRRTSSTGFILDEDEDIFEGDGLEQEREWLAHFRHRSTNPSRSMSRRNSSRYSFSSDFSSDLEDIYEHFEEKMTEGPVRDDPAIRCRLGDKLKRTLSDSLTSFPRTSLGCNPRSMSLTDKMKQEQLNLEYAKHPNIDKASAAHLTFGDPAPDFRSGELCISMMDQDDGLAISPPVSGKLVGTTYNVAIEQTLSEIEESITLPLPPKSLTNLSRFPSQLSVWWDYNSVYDFCVPLNQFNNRHRLQACQLDNLNSCSLTIGKMTHSTTEDNLDLPNRILSELTDDTCMTVGPMSAGKHQLTSSSSSNLQVPTKVPFGIYRSKSASNTDELARSAAASSVESLSFDSLLSTGIVKSQSFKDVLRCTRNLQCKLANKLENRGGSHSFVPLLNGNSGLQGRLRKWEPAFNLNDVGQMEATTLCQFEASTCKSVTNNGNASTVNKKTLQENGKTNTLSNYLGNISCTKRSLTGTSSVKKPQSSSSYGLSVNVEQLIQQMEDVNGVRPVITTSHWGCDADKGGDPQLKTLIQWMAASRATVPYLVFYTGGDHRTVKLNIVSRLLLDRHWCVSHIAHAIVSYYNKPVRQKSLETGSPPDLFESLLPKETDL